MSTTATVLAAAGVLVTATPPRLATGSVTEVTAVGGSAAPVARFGIPTRTVRAAGDVAFRAPVAGRGARAAAGFVRRVGRVLSCGHRPIIARAGGAPWSPRPS